MGVTIHYCGTLDDISQVETMEDRMLDLVFSLGGRATIWRSFADQDSSRVVRGLLVDLEPGQDTFSLLVSPEGHLTPLFQIEDAEKAPFDEPPYCFVKTQFGSLQGHITIVHLLDALRQRFCSNLEVSDEGEYYENRDVDQLTLKIGLLRSAIHSMAEGLKTHGLNAEAAASGLSVDEALELAMKEEGLPVLPRDLPEPFDSAPSEAWTESLPANPFDEASERSRSVDHPAVVQAQAFLMQVIDLVPDDSKPSSFFSILMRAFETEADPEGRRTLVYSLATAINHAESPYQRETILIDCETILHPLSGR